MTHEEIIKKYGIKAMLHLSELFNEDNENFIDLKQVNADGELTELFHAIANIAPAHLYNQLTGQENDLLTFNQTANTLCFQYCNKED